MLTVYLLLKHPPSPFNHKLHLSAAEVVDVYLDRSEPDRIAEEKNKADTRFQWSVKAKRVKRPAAPVAAPAPATAETGFPAKAWIADFTDSQRPRLGRVKDSYFLNGVRLVDVVLFSHKGKKVGRESPACGGPRGFEPACAAEHWSLIKTPDFEQLGEINTTWGHLVERLDARA